MMTPESRVERAKVQLERAIQTMRDACDDAERRLKHDSGNIACAVSHALTWGLANAMSSVETAHASLDEAHELRLLRAKD